MQAVEEFRTAIEAAGLTAPQTIIADGKLHRFASNGDPKDNAGYYVFHSDGIPAGEFGDHRTGIKQPWCAKSYTAMTATERAENRRRMEEARRQREADEQHRHEDAAKRARTIWEEAPLAHNGHPYLQKKRVQPHDIKIDDNDRLIVPVYIDDVLTSLQFIDEDGDKKFLPGGEVKGGSFILGELTSATTLLVCEGFATAASLHEATGLPVVMAFNAGNLLSVAQQLRRQYPTATIVLCGDNDFHADGKENTGVVKATAAAKAIHASVAIPDVINDTTTDFNDVHVQLGLAAVKAMIEAAIRTAQATTTSETDTDDSLGKPASMAYDQWPQLDPLTLHGVMGDLVRLIAPHTEADPVALLIQGLVAFGNTLNRRPHFRAEADVHPMNLFAVLVGETSKGRKGTSWGYIRQLFRSVDEEWTSGRVVSGLSSGEGLIWAVRDEITKTEPLKEKGKPTGQYHTIVVDPGIEDKRLFVLEPEFASALHVSARDGNTLTAIIRQAWDAGDLRTMTKNSSTKATGAHISIMGHITKDELLRLLDTTEAANGYCNRFLWACVRRSKCLPEGGRLDEVDVTPLAQRLLSAVQFGRRTGEIRRDPHARDLWCEVYPTLSEGKPGLLGAIVSRSEAQVMRLACLYALFDHSALIREEHLRAALALWGYCEASARYIFGHRLGDPIADELLCALRQHPIGMTRTEIRDWFGRNRKAHELDRGLGVLTQQRLARSETHGSGGRPSERWFLTTTETTKAG